MLVQITKRLVDATKASGLGITLYANEKQEIAGISLEDLRTVAQHYVDLAEAQASKIKAIREEHDARVRRLEADLADSRLGHQQMYDLAAGRVEELDKLRKQFTDCDFARCTAETAYKGECEKRATQVDRAAPLEQEIDRLNEHVKALQDGQLYRAEYYRERTKVHELSEQLDRANAHTDKLNAELRAVSSEAAAATRANERLLTMPGGKSVESREQARARESHERYLATSSTRAATTTELLRLAREQTFLLAQISKNTEPKESK